MDALVKRSNGCENRDLSPSDANVVGSLNFHTFAIILGAACTLLACVVCFLTILDHLCHCTKVSEQKYIIRIICMVPAFAIFGLITTIWYPAYLYMLHVPAIVEAIGLCGLLELFVLHAIDTPDRSRQGLFFQKLEHLSRFKQTKVDDRGSLQWFRMISFRVYQYPWVTTITVIIEILGAAFLCHDGKPEKVVKVLVSIVTVLTTMAAVLGIIIFYRRLKPKVKPYHGVSRLIVIKALVHVVVLQSFIISIVDNAGALTPTSTMSYGDLSSGLPSLMTCIWMLLFSGLFSWSFRAAPYKRLQTHSAGSAEILVNGQYMPNSSKLIVRKTSPLQALLAVLNISDIFRGLRDGIRNFFGNGKNEHTVGAYSEELGAWPDQYSAASPSSAYQESGPKFDMGIARSLDAAPPSYDGSKISPARARHA